MTSAALGIIIYFLTIICMVVGYILVLVALWRLAIANESISKNTKEIAEILKSENENLKRLPPPLVPAECRPRERPVRKTCKRPPKAGTLALISEGLGEMPG
ncbi:MAG: hypothetical protein VR69_15615 [Peptococcaceae bacterium BRH_c4b]|nr:MAG: hypothetical protein VR69_15615 [Peptococcaceae bacterium BRH_c4b]